MPIKQWLAKRRAERDMQARKNGFGWAMAEFYLAQKAIPDIQAQCDGGEPKEFDVGASFAVGMIQETHYFQHVAIANRFLAALRDIRDKIEEQIDGDSSGDTMYSEWVRELDAVIAGATQ